MKRRFGPPNVEVRRCDAAVGHSVGSAPTVSANPPVSNNPSARRRAAELDVARVVDPVVPCPAERPLVEVERTSTVAHGEDHLHRSDGSAVVDADRVARPAVVARYFATSTARDSRITITLT